MNEKLAEIKGLLRGLLWGILLTLGAAFFLETESGQKLKKRLKERGEDWLAELPDILDRWEKKGEELIEEASRVEKEVKEKMDQADQEITAQTGEKLEASLNHIKVLQTHGREITGSIKRRLFKNIPKKVRPD